MAVCANETKDKYDWRDDKGDQGDELDGRSSRVGLSTVPKTLWEQRAGISDDNC